MNNELTIRICGEAGQGMQTIGETLCALYKSAGFNLFAHQDYMSRVRGGNNFYQLRIASRPLYALRALTDMVVALDKASVALHVPAVAAGGRIILDKKKFALTEENGMFFDIPFYELAAQAGGSQLFISSVACGAVSALTGMEFALLEDVLKKTFTGKPLDIIDKNLAAARAGYDFAAPAPEGKKFRLPPSRSAGELLVNGNEAIALGAIRAGCKFYSAYPMTPSTSIMDTLAHYAQQYNIIVEQAEDEIAAINMVVGASFAGIRAMTGTSGGGFALMTEGVSLAGMTETPAVIAVAQRPGPATGFPTRTEQADLNFILHSGHGEFARAVFTPGTAEEAFYLTVKAFNLAEEFQVPVFIITDQHLADSYRDFDTFDLDKARVRRYIISKAEAKGLKGYQRYRLTDSGISPRAVPSWINDVVYVDSDEHTEAGHITEDAGVRRAMVEKRYYKKLAGLAEKIVKPSCGGLDGADLVLVGFGSTYGVLKESAEETKAGFIHLSQVWPFPAEECAVLLKGARKIFTVENNAGAQLAGLLRRETGIKVDGSILKFDGRPFGLDELCARIQKERTND